MYTFVETTSIFACIFKLKYYIKKSFFSCINETLYIQIRQNTCVKSVISTNFKIIKNFVLLFEIFDTYK